VLAEVSFPEPRQHVHLSVAILRRPAAIDYLAGLVASEPEPAAIEPLSALRIYKDDPRLHERIAKLVSERSSPSLQAGFDRDFQTAGR
jgi:hypothetical protein